MRLHVANKEEGLSFSPSLQEIHMFNNITGQKGTARFAVKSDFGTFEETVDFSKHVYVGKNLPESVGNSQQDIIAETKKNVSVFGGTGSAKTTAIIDTNILIRQTSFFAIDPKGSSFRRLAPYLKARGYYVHCLAPFTPELSCSINPLDGLTSEDPEYVDFIELLVAALIIVSASDPHWGNSARRLVAGLFAYVVETPGEEASLGRVMEILCSGLGVITKIAKAVAIDTTTYRSDSLTRRKLARFAELTSDNREAQSIMSTALTEMNFLDSTAICQCLSKSDFSFEDLVDPNKKVAVFLIIPSEKLETYNRFSRLMVSMAINTISRIGGDPDRPIDLYIDEAGTIGHLPILSQGVALMRERGMRFWTVFQSLSQLQRDYPSDWKNFIGNSNPIFLLDVMDSDEAEYFSKMLGETTLEMKNGQEYSQDVSDLPYMLQNRFNCHYKWINTSEQIHGTSSRPLMTPEELRRLPENVGIVITDGHPAVFVKAKCYEAEPFCNVIPKNHIR